MHHAPAFVHGFRFVLTGTLCLTFFPANPVRSETRAVEIRLAPWERAVARDRGERDREEPPAERDVRGETSEVRGQVPETTEIELPPRIASLVTRMTGTPRRAMALRLPQAALVPAAPPAVGGGAPETSEVVFDPDDLGLPVATIGATEIPEGPEIDMRRYRPAARPATFERAIPKRRAGFDLDRDGVFSREEREYLRRTRMPLPAGFRKPAPPEAD